MTLQQKLCLKTSGKTKIVLSTQDPVSCEGSKAYCAGNSLDNLWNYLTKKGTVTDTCFPYVAGTKQQAACPTKCKNGETWKKYYGNGYRRTSGVDNMKNSLYNEGPIEVIFYVYEDFYNYKSGIYKHTKGSQVGAHAVALIGYGTEGGVNYWICQNSWGQSWGESGFFRIKMGEVGINDYAYIGSAKV
ncbi:MAG: hypothetical protein MJ252_30465 [archaeon]|nr:hypothetical protein [archaeon]